MEDFQKVLHGRYGEFKLYRMILGEKVLSYELFMAGDGIVTRDSWIATFSNLKIAHEVIYRLIRGYGEC